MTPQPRLARNITVRREANDPAARVFIDGEELPWFTAKGIHPAVEFGESPQVTLTLLAETVTVADQFLYGASDQLVHDHGDTGAG